MTNYFLGVDIGGTKSHALIADDNGHALGFGQAGGGNWENVGWDGTRQALHECVQMALNKAGIQPSQIQGSGYGVAGYDWPEDRVHARQVIESLGLATPYELVNDTIIGLIAGTPNGWGVAVVAGTGSNCRGRDREKREARVTGMSSEYGEYGGASEIVEKALEVTAKAWARRAPPTALSDAFLSMTDAQDIEDMIAGISRGRYDVSPDAARLVFQVARDGDPIAQEIIQWAGKELADLASGVIRQLGFENSAFDVILIGSTINSNENLKDIMKKHIKLVAPHAHLVPLTVPPVIGGVLLGVEQVGLETIGIRQTLIETTSKLVNEQRIP